MNRNGKNNYILNNIKKSKTISQKYPKEDIIIIKEEIKYLYIKYSWKKIIQKQKKNFI
jgi:hypothetical protein